MALLSGEGFLVCSRHVGADPSGCLCGGCYPDCKLNPLCLVSRGTGARYVNAHDDRRNFDQLTVDRVGLRYVGSVVSQGVALTIDRLRERCGDLVGELPRFALPRGYRHGRI